MVRLALLSGRGAAAGDVLPALSLLPHDVTPLPATAAGIAAARSAAAVVVDAVTDLAAGRALCQGLHSAAGGPTDGPGVLVVVPEGGLAAVQPDWGAVDLVLPTAGPAEVDARIRLLAARRLRREPPTALRVGDLVVDPTTFQVQVGGRLLDLTFREFELLRFLAGRPGRVATRSQLLLEVWGYDYYGGERTVDVHVRRLRAKLGAEHESMIATVRGVGYKLVPAEQARAEREQAVSEPGVAAVSEPGVAAVSGPGVAAAPRPVARRGGVSFDTSSAEVARSRSLPPVGR